MEYPFPNMHVHVHILYFKKNYPALTLSVAPSTVLLMAPLTLSAALPIAGLALSIPSLHTHVNNVSCLKNNNNNNNICYDCVSLVNVEAPTTCTPFSLNFEFDPYFLFLFHLLDIVDSVGGLPYSHMDGIVFLDLLNELFGTAIKMRIHTFLLDTGINPLLVFWDTHETNTYVET